MCSFFIKSEYVFGLCILQKISLFNRNLRLFPHKGKHNVSLFSLKTAVPSFSDTFYLQSAFEGPASCKINYSWVRVAHEQTSQNWVKSSHRFFGHLKDSRTPSSFWKQDMALQNGSEICKTKHKSYEKTGNFKSEHKCKSTHLNQRVVSCVSSKCWRQELQCFQPVWALSSLLASWETLAKPSVWPLPACCHWVWL